MKKLGTLINKLKKSDDLKELSINSLWSLFGSIISKGLIFFAWLMVAEMLGKIGNGQVGIVRSTINLFMIFVGSGIALTTTKYIPELLNYDKSKVGGILTFSILFSVLLGLVLSIFLYVGAAFFSEYILNEPALTEVLRISSFLLFLSVISSLLTGCLKGFKDFKGLLIVNFIYGICLFGFLYVGTKLYGVEGTFMGFTAGTLILVILGIFFLKKNMVKYNLNLNRISKDEIKIFRKFTLPAILTGIMVMPFKWAVDAIMVNQEFGYKELGLYAAIILFQNLIMMITATLDAPLITIMVKDEISLKVKKLNLIIPWAIGILMVLPVFFYPSIFNMFLGEEYINDVNYRNTLFLVLLTTAIILYKQGIARIMIVNNLMWLSFMSNFIWGLLLISTFYLMSNKNAETLALSYFFAYMVNTVIIIPIYLKKKIIPVGLIKSKWAIIIWSVFSGTFVTLYFCDVENFLLKITFFIFVFGLLVVSFYRLLIED